MPEMNVVGKPYEGKLHVRFDVAGDGKGFTKATYHSLTLLKAAHRTWASVYAQGLPKVL